MHQRAVLVAVLSVLLACVCRQAMAEEVIVAVAANFLETLETLESRFERHTGHDLILAAGSTGSLYAQIANGAPYAVFLAADEARPARALEAGLAVPGTDFVYALGILVLYSREPDRAIGPETLQGDFHHLAIANPRTAPYGRAAMEVLQSLGLADALAGRIAEAQSVNGAYAAVASGAADLGFVALSAVLQHGSEGRWWAPPADTHAPLRQTAVMLTRGRDNPAATAFLDFLRSPEAVNTMRAAGYRGP